MMLVVHTQIYENYGDKEHPYWKPKGGMEHKILDVPSYADLGSIVNNCGIEFSSDYYRESILGYNLEYDQYLSQYEKTQLELDGIIGDPEPHQHYNTIHK